MYPFNFRIDVIRPVSSYLATQVMCTAHELLDREINNMPSFSDLRLHVLVRLFENDMTIP